MFHKFRERFGTAGLVVSVVALVFALAGGAFAASGGLNAKQKKQVKAIAKSFQGTGPAGAPGLAGLAGAKGDTGAAGADGATGPQGPIGNTGPQGPIGNTGPQGPIGNTGPQGPVGSPWTAGGTLPPGATLTGTYVGAGSDVAPALGSITFPIPLPLAIDATHSKKINVGDTVPAECAGGTLAQPDANPGYLCVFNGLVSGGVIQTVLDPASGGSGASVAGTAVLGEVAGGGLFAGTYAVTACGNVAFPCP